MNDVRNNAEKVYTGCLTENRCENNLHRTGGTRTPNKIWNSIFCKSTKIWGQTTWVFGTVELRNSLRFDKKYFGRSHFCFVIFSLV